MGTGICYGTTPQKHVHVPATTRQQYAHAQKSSSKEDAVSGLYHEEELGRRSAAKLLTKDEARKIGANIAKLPELFLRK